MNTDGSRTFKIINSVPIAGFNSDFINYSWNASGSQIIYPYLLKLYRINERWWLIKIYQSIKRELSGDAIGAMM
jgi:hypothetical protein